MTKTCNPETARECVEWVRRVNGRWLVHDGLNEAAREYLDHLAVTAPERLGRSCRIAHALVAQSRGVEDPKPRFYGGLFSLATPSEAERFFAGRLFVSSLWPGGHFALSEGVSGVSKETVERMRALREEIRAVSVNL